MSVAVSADKTAPATRRRKVSQAAKTTTIFLVVFAIAGAIWGWWRPVVTAVVTDTGGASIDPSTTGAPFQGFAVYAVVTGVLGAVLGAWAFWRIPTLRGPVMLLAVIALALIGSAVFLLLVNWLADTLHSDDLPGDLTPGEELLIVSQVSGAAGYLAAPAAAVVVYWCCALFSPDEAFER